MINLSGEGEVVDKHWVHSAQIQPPALLGIFPSSSFSQNKTELFFLLTVIFFSNNVKHISTNMKEQKYTLEVTLFLAIGIMQ